MNQLMNIARAVASTILVYFLHTALKGEAIPIVLFVLSVFIVTVDHPRRYYYLVGLVLYPMVTILSVAIARDQSLYPIVIFYELSMVVMVLFGTFLGIKIQRWMQSRNL